MKLKRYKSDKINENRAMYFTGDNKTLSEDDQKFDIIEKLSQHWSEKLRNDYLVPRSLYRYSLDQLKEIEKHYLNEDIDYDIVGRLMKEHGWGDIMDTEATEEFETSEYYKGDYKSDKEYADDFDSYMRDNADGSIQENKKFDIGNDGKVNYNDGSALRYIDNLAEEYGQEYTLNLYGELDNYTDITSAFKSGMKKQIELLKNNKNKVTSTFDSDKVEEKLTPDNYSMQKALKELKDQHLSNDAVEDIRIEGDDIIFDVKCETDIQGVTEYNGFKLKYNKLCEIKNVEKSEQEIIEHAQLIKECVLNEYLNQIK